MTKRFSIGFLTCLVLLANNLVVVFFLNRYSGEIPYPDWATGIGWGLVAISAIQIPLWAFIMSIYYLIKGKLSQVCSDLGSQLILKPIFYFP